MEKLQNGIFDTTLVSLDIAIDNMKMHGGQYSHLYWQNGTFIYIDHQIKKLMINTPTGKFKFTDHYLFNLGLFLENYFFLMDSEL